MWRGWARADAWMDGGPAPALMRAHLGGEHFLVRLCTDTSAWGGGERRVKEAAVRWRATTEGSMRGDTTIPIAPAAAPNARATHLDGICSKTAGGKASSASGGVVPAEKSKGVACLRLAGHAPLEVLVLVDALNERPDIVRHLSRARRLSARQPRVSKSIGSDDRRCETRRRLRSATATTSRSRSAASWLQGPGDAQSAGNRFGKSPALAKASENESVARRRVAVSLFAAL